MADFPKVHVSVVVGFAVTAAMSGCGGSDNPQAEVRGYESAASTISTGASSPASSTKPVVRRNPAQQPEPSVTAHCNEVPLGHACRAVTATPSDPNESAQRNCTPDIAANAGTSCGLAENTFYEYYKAKESGKESTIEVYSPVTHQNYELDCTVEDDMIGCVSSPTGDGVYVSFSKSAMEAYSGQDAAAYAASHEVGNPPPPYAPPTTEAKPESTSTESGEDEIGSHSHSGDAAFCEAHRCIGNFTTEDGTVVECSDGSYSHAGGVSGACSHHGGEKE